MPTFAETWVPVDSMVAAVSLEEVAAEVAVVLHVPDHRFDGGPAPELTLDDAVDVAPLP